MLMLSHAWNFVSFLDLELSWAPNPAWGSSQSYSTDLELDYNLYVGRSWGTSEVLFD